ncbi:phage baseplate assembly protein V, partial [Capnocytophaga canis]|uniref:phage baseplate assembly protein V n=1 Tax=Capnocytophaga canis TaxID=1848903 RepID=UPI001F508358
TEWIRVMTPDAGGSDKVSKNRGFVAIPEIGDQVMVGFIHNHPDRPYVMGSLFHGKVGSGGGSGNNVKSLSSKSGHTIELNDAGGITIRDKQGNKTVLDGAGNVSVDAQSTISLKTGESSILLDSSGMITIKGKDISVEGTNSVKAKIGDNDYVQVTSGKIDIVSTDIAITGEEKASVSAKQTTITGDSKATLTSQGPTTLEGAIVKLN